MPLLVVAFGVILLLILIIFFKLNAFISLILVSLTIGLVQGMPIASLVASIQKGVGDTLGLLALVMGFGAMLGKLLSDTGAAQRIAYSLIDFFGKKGIQWAVVITGFVVGSAMFYNAGFIILIPLIFTIANVTNLPILYVGLPMAASLSVTHGYLPPHPGPTAIAVIFKADIGLTLLYGFFIAIPAIILAGPFFGSFFKNFKVNPPTGLFTGKSFKEEEMPGFGISLITAVIPIVLMASDALVKLLLPEESPLRKIFSFIGDPVIALLLSVIIALFTLGIFRKHTMDELMKSITESISGIAMILLIIGGGGAFKQVLVDSGVGVYMTEALKDTTLSPLIFSWGISALLRVTLGSATVAAMTTAGIVLPLITATSVSPELMVLAVGAGSLMFSHVNDPGFWLFKEFFNLSIPQTFVSWSIMETIVSVMGLIGVLVMEQIIM